MDVIKATETVTNEIDKLLLEKCKDLTGIKVSMDSSFGRGRITIRIEENEEA